MKVKDESINAKLLECAKAEFMEKGFADASMRTIAERAGFESPKYFSRIFRAKMGISPKSYRAQMRKI